MLPDLFAAFWSYHQIYAIDRIVNAGKRYAESHPSRALFQGTARTGCDFGLEPQDQDRGHVFVPTFIVSLSPFLRLALLPEAAALFGATVCIVIDVRQKDVRLDMQVWKHSWTII